jgi:hypothetical protein
MRQILTPFDLPGAPADAARLLERQADSVNHAVRELHRRVSNIADYALAVVIDNYQPNGKRRVRIEVFARADVPKMPDRELVAPLLADEAPEGMLHLVVLTDYWQSHTLVPSQAATTALH